MKDELTRMIAAILEPKSLDPQDIPDIDLYMDQVLTFMDTRLSKYKRNPREKVYTKTMINNYAKAGLILPPEKKKYSRENMMLLLLIYRLKQILSIQDIAALFSAFGRDKASHDSNSLIQEAYRIFREIEKIGQEDFGGMCSRKAELISELVSGYGGRDKSDLEWMLMALFLVNQADMQRRLAEQIIDAHFIHN